MDKRGLSWAMRLVLLSSGSIATAQSSSSSDWLYNGGPRGDHFSALTQVTPANVATLQEAWRFPMPPGGMESQPIMVGRTVYAVTTARQLVALDAASGQVKWTFDPKLTGLQPVRGLSTWQDGDKLRLLFGREQYVYMIDAETGQPVTTFGDQGHIDARENLRGAAADNNIYITSPVGVYRDTIIVNGRLAENTPASPGDVRAYDAHSGKLLWTFHTIPHAGEAGAESWPKDAYRTQGGANAWSGSTVDPERGIVFVNTGSPADDFYGAERLGNNRFANSTIALDARTGRRIWDFQQVHHDLWDSDSTSPPLLTAISRAGRKVDVAVATNKQSYIYVFDRATGRPIFPIVETPVPPSNVPGEVASRTQPIPSLPAPLSRKKITADDLTTATPEANAWARAAFAKLRGADGPYIPVGLNQDTLVIPGFGGGSKWGGMAADRSGTLYVNAGNGASMTSLVENKPPAPGESPTARQFGGAQNGVPSLKYGFTGYGQFRTPEGQNAIGAPLETLNAVDLNTGQYRWKIPFTGGGGGPSVTAAGLLFIGSTNNLNAYDTTDGKLLWSQKLPATNGMTPAVYMVDGRQYVLVGSAGRGTPAYIAYALPK